MEVYIAGEGYDIHSGFLLKEMCVMFSNKEYSQFVFKTDDVVLSEGDYKAIRDAVKHTSKLSFHDGDIPSHLVCDILERYQEYTIYTYSEEMCDFIQHHLPTTIVINVQDKGLTLKEQLPDPICFRRHPPNFCAKAKAIEIRNFMDNYINLM